MKMKRAHKVILSKQAMQILEMVKLFSRDERFVFVNQQIIKPMSENAMGYLLNRTGYHGVHVPHGFRASFSSIMNERYPGERAVIDLMLAHVSKNAVEAAYNRAENREKRRKLYQLWSDLLFEDFNLLQTLINKG